MENTERPQKPLDRLKRSIRERFRRKNPQTTPEDTSPQLQESERAKALNLTRQFLILQKLVEDANTQAEEIPIEGSESGHIEALQMMELMTSQESISLADAQAGDAIWWRDENGHNGYFIVNRQDTSAFGNPVKVGALKIDSDEGVIDYPEAQILGASFSPNSMLVQDKIAKNIPVHYKKFFPERSMQLSDAERQERQGYVTAPVRAMGIVKAEQLSAQS